MTVPDATPEAAVLAKVLHDSGTCSYEPVCACTDHADSVLASSWLAQRDARVRAEALREARAIVERQTDLTELVIFDRPSDFCKGVLTCLTALDAAIKEALS